MKYKNKKLNLFGTIWTIKYVKGVLDVEGGQAFGVTDTKEHSIEISISDNNGKSFSDNEIKLTLYHELMHAFLYNGQYLDIACEEHLVEWLARCINECVKKEII